MYTIQCCACVNPGPPICTLFNFVFSHILTGVYLGLQMNRVTFNQNFTFLSFGKPVDYTAFKTMITQCNPEQGFDLIVDNGNHVYATVPSTNYDFVYYTDHRDYQVTCTDCTHCTNCDHCSHCAHCTELSFCTDCVCCYDSTFCADCSLCGHVCHGVETVYCIQSSFVNNVKPRTKVTPELESWIHEYLDTLDLYHQSMVLHCTMAKVESKVKNIATLDSTTVNSVAIKAIMYQVVKLGCTTMEAIQVLCKDTTTMEYSRIADACETVDIENILLEHLTEGQKQGITKIDQVITKAELRLSRLVYYSTNCTQCSEVEHLSNCVNCVDMAFIMDKITE